MWLSAGVSCSESGRESVLRNVEKERRVNEASGSTKSLSVTKADSGFFQALFAHYCHQNGLMWSRVQTFVAIQGAVLTGAYSMRERRFPSIMLLTLGAGLAVVLTCMFKRDEEIREGNIDLIKGIGKKLAQEATGSPGALFEIAPKRRFLRGGFLCVVTFTGFIALDIIWAVTVTYWLPPP
jgi:hypothetical protein